MVDPSLAFMQNLQQQMGDSQLQSLPPAVQKAIFLHLTQQQQQQESHPQGNEPQRAEGQDDSSNRGQSQEQEAKENPESIQNCIIYKHADREPTFKHVNLICR